MILKRLSGCACIEIVYVFFFFIFFNLEMTFCLDAVTHEIGTL